MGTYCIPNSPLPHSPRKLLPYPFKNPQRVHSKKLQIPKKKNQVEKNAAPVASNAEHSPFSPFRHKPEGPVPVSFLRQVIAQKYSSHV